MKEYRTSIATENAASISMKEYKALQKKVAQLEMENQHLDEVILEIFYDSKKRYGAPKITDKLLELYDIYVSMKHVQRRMAILGIRSIVVKKVRHFTNNVPVAEKKRY